MADLATNVVLKIVVLTFNRICTTPVLKHDFKNLKYEAENISNNNISGHYLLKDNEKVANYVRKRGRNLRNTIFLNRGGF